MSKLFNKKSFEVFKKFESAKGDPSVYDSEEFNESVRKPFELILNELADMARNEFKDFNLEVSKGKVNSKHVSRQNKLFYHFWGALFRKELESKSNDLQIFWYIKKDIFKFGIFFGDKIEEAMFQKILNNFKNNSELIKNTLKGISSDFKTPKLLIDDKHGYLIEELNVDELNNSWEKIKKNGLNICYVFSSDEMLKKDETFVKDIRKGIVKLLPIYRCLINNTLKEYELEKSNMSIKNEQTVALTALNTIFFGPPGTGKTHELIKLQNKFLGRKASENDRLKEFISTLSWWEVVAVTLADIGKAVSVAELQEHKFIKEKVSQSKLDRARPGNVLWSNLQSHASEDSKTVNVAKKHGVLIFDKTNDAKWYLVDNWKEQVNDLAIEFEQYKKGQFKVANENRFSMVTFHQSYSYEDFVEGIRPKLDSDSSDIEYEIKKGVFREICELAENHPDEEFAIFIDEINRGNISKIFGELITLIETDKRISASDPSKGIRVKLPYSRIDFGVPENLFIIGTMNSVDRSVALVDMALRRRFEFQSVRPKVEKVDEKGNIKDVDLKKIFLNLNNKITVLLGNEYVIGHSYFMNENVTDLKTFKRTWFNKILPLLQEYFFDDWKKIKALVKDFVREESINGLEDLSLPFDGNLYSFKTIEVEDKDFITMLKGLE